MCSPIHKNHSRHSGLPGDDLSPTQPGLSYSLQHPTTTSYSFENVCKFFNGHLSASQETSSATNLVEYAAHNVSASQETSSADQNEYTKNIDFKVAFQIRLTWLWNSSLHSDVKQGINFTKLFINLCSEIDKNKDLYTAGTVDVKRDEKFYGYLDEYTKDNPPPLLNTYRKIYLYAMFRIIKEILDEHTVPLPLGNKTLGYADIEVLKEEIHKLEEAIFDESITDGIHSAGIYDTIRVNELKNDSCTVSITNGFFRLTTTNIIFGTLRKGCPNTIISLQEKFKIVVKKRFVDLLQGCSSIEERVYNLSMDIIEFADTAQPKSKDSINIRDQFSNYINEKQSVKGFQYKKIYCMLAIKLYGIITAQLSNNLPAVPNSSESLIATTVNNRKQINESSPLYACIEVSYSKKDDEDEILLQFPKNNVSNMWTNNSSKETVVFHLKSLPSQFSDAFHNVE